MKNFNYMTDEQLWDWYDEDPRGFFLEYGRYIANATLSSLAIQENQRRLEQEAAEREAEEARLREEAEKAAEPPDDAQSKPEPETHTQPSSIDLMLQNTREHGGLTEVLTERVLSRRGEEVEAPEMGSDEDDLVETMEELI